MVFMCVEAGEVMPPLLGSPAKPAALCFGPLEWGVLVATGSWYPTHSQASGSFLCLGLDVLTLDVFRVSDASWSLPQCTSQVALLEAVVQLVRV